VGAVFPVDGFVGAVGAVDGSVGAVFSGGSSFGGGGSDGQLTKTSVKQTKNAKNNLVIFIKVSRNQKICGFYAQSRLKPDIYVLPLNLRIDAKFSGSPLPQ
jgi:hypothetical protein